MSGEYDRHERQAARRDVGLILAGCGLVVLAVIGLFVAYGVWLVHSGWRG